MIKTLPYEGSDSVPYVAYYSTAEDDKQNPLTYGVNRNEKRQNPSRERKINLALFVFCVYQRAMKIPMTKLFGITEDTKDITLKVLYSKRPMVGTTNKGAIL